MGKKKIAWIVGVLLALSYPFAFFLISRSDAYTEAKSFLQTHPQVVEQVGTIQAVSPAWFGSTLRLSGPAQLLISVVGDRGSAKALIDLNQLDGKWKVTHAQLTKGTDDRIDLSVSQ